MLKKLKNNFVKYFSILMVVMLLVAVFCVSASAYDYNGTQLELYVTGLAGGALGEQFRFLGREYFGINGVYSMADTFTSSVYYFYYDDETAFNGYKQEIYEHIAADIPGFDFNNYYPVIIIDEFNAEMPEYEQYECHAITGVYNFSNDTYYYSTGLMYGNTVIVLGNDFDGGELYYEGTYLDENTYPNSNVTQSYLLIPVDSPFFRQWCPYDFSDYADLVTVYNSGYDDGVADTKALFDNSYYGLLYNSIGELVYGDVGELTDTQALVLNLVSMVLSLAIIVIPIIVLLLVVKLVMRR